MKFIILDRDGVINHDSDHYIKAPEEFHPIAGSLEAIAKLNKAGYRVLVVTNQSGIARGLYDHQTLVKIHEKLMKNLSAVGGAIEEIFFCPHHPSEGCDCRKPKPGLFNQIKEKYHVNLADTYFVGDKMTDIDVAELVGCKPMLLLTGRGTETLKKHPKLESVAHFDNLAQAVEFILSSEK